MKKRRKLWTGLLLIVFLISTGCYVWHLYNTRTAEQSISLARTLAESAVQESPAPETLPPETLPGRTVWMPAPVEDPRLEELAKLNLESLQQVNPQVVGWIWIPDTPVDYPVVQGEDNSYYLDYTWDKQRSDSGAIFLEVSNQTDMTEFHTILYGHNMRSGTMFASIREYRSGEYWNQHPYVYLLTDAGAFRYEVYSSYLAKVSSATYHLKQQKEDSKTAFIQYTTEESVLDTGIVPAHTDRILTLSTCSGLGYSTRWVLHARLMMVEKPE